MDKIHEASWWPDFVRKLDAVPLGDLARIYGVPASSLESGLLEIGPGKVIHEAPFWPELVRRLRRGGSLREAARRWKTNPRRIRRALARCGVRVGGLDLMGEGLEELRPLRGQLGRIPDILIARKAAVPVEAVQGERRRLGIAPFRHRSQLRARPMPPREAPQPVIPMVVRRPAAVGRNLGTPVNLPPPADDALRSTGRLEDLPKAEATPEAPKRRIIRPGEKKAADGKMMEAKSGEIKAVSPVAPPVFESRPADLKGMDMRATSPVRMGPTSRSPSSPVAEPPALENKPTTVKANTAKVAATKTMESQTSETPVVEPKTRKVASTPRSPRTPKG